MKRHFVVMLSLTFIVAIVYATITFSETKSILSYYLEDNNYVYYEENKVVMPSKEIFYTTYSEPNSIPVGFAPAFYEDENMLTPMLFMFIEGTYTDKIQSISFSANNSEYNFATISDSGMDLSGQYTQISIFLDDCTEIELFADIAEARQFGFSVDGDSELSGTVTIEDVSQWKMFYDDFVRYGGLNQATVSNIDLNEEDNQSSDSVSVLAKETDYSYLEEMSVKELKELRDAINEILGDGGGIVANSGSEYGTVTGSITYNYNDFKGHVADTDSTVILIPTDAVNIDINTDDLVSMSVQRDFAFGDGVYYSTVNGMGTFTISHVPAGEYLIWIASGNTNTGAWFDAYDSHDEEAIVPYYKSVAAQASGLITEDDAYNIAKAIGPNQSHYDNVTVYSGETTVFDYDFGYTYLS